MRMRLHRRILKEVLETDEKEREQEIGRMMPTLRSLVDDATYITGLEDGVGALIALYILCTSHNINTVNHYQEIQERLEYLFNDLLGDMLEKFPPRLPTEED